MVSARRIPLPGLPYAGLRLAQRIRARLPTYLSDLRENPAWLAMFVLGRTTLGRRLHWRAALPASYGAGEGATIFEGVDCEAVLSALRGRGLSQGINLPPPVTAEIARFAFDTPCFANFDRRQPFLPGEHALAERQFDRAISSGHYFERALDCAAVRRVQSDPLLGQIAARYLGAQARLIRTRVWWTFPTRAVPEADKSMASLEKFHFDLDDWRTLKFFFYILPVGDGGGAHVYLCGSHLKHRLKHQLSLFVGHPEREVLRAYGAENMAVLTGEAGFGFAEDPFGFHMGRVPTDTPRLMLEVGYGVSRGTRRGFYNEPVLH